MFDTQLHPRTIRSFVLRQGRLTGAQQRALDQYWIRYGVDFSAQLLPLDALFGRRAARTLEIGFGNGESLLQQAQAHPERDYLGIEVHRPGVGRLLHRVQELGLCNLRVSNHDAIEVIDVQLADASLDCVQLFFPDPWHKKRHHKRRIVQPGFVRQIARKLQPGGRLHMATDWQDYAEHMLLVMASQGDFSNLSGAGQFADLRAAPLRPDTRFEQRGRKLGHTVYDLVFEKAEVE